MFWFIVILLLVGAGFYFYQKMMDIEREIRAEQEAVQASASVAVEPEKKQPETEPASDPPIVTPEVEKMAAKASPVVDETLSLADEVLVAVKNLPGVKQTELYESFSDVNKKQLQQLLKELADTGKLKREKQGSSYLLFPV